MQPLQGQVGIVPNTRYEPLLLGVSGQGAVYLGRRIITVRFEILLTGNFSDEVSSVSSKVITCLCAP